MNKLLNQYFQISLKYFQEVLIGSFGIALALFLMSELSIYAQQHWINYVYFMLAMAIMFLFLYYSSKILKHYPILLLGLLVVSFYILIGHGFVINEWQNKSNGIWISVSSSQELTNKIKLINAQKTKVKAVKPIAINTIVNKYRGAYHHYRTRDSKQVDIWYHAVPYADEQQVIDKNFTIWIACTSDHNLIEVENCFDKINTNTGGGYITFSRFEYKAVNNAISSYGLKPIDNPVILKWSQNIDAEISKHLKVNSKIIKFILLGWILISSLVFLFFRQPSSKTQIQI